MANENLKKLYIDELKDLYSAENQLVKALPKMAKAAQSEELKAAFVKHLTETEGQIERLEKVFAVIEKKPQGKTCAAIVGITEEGAEIMEEYKGSPALDAGLLAAAQAVERLLGLLAAEQEATEQRARLVRRQIGRASCRERV